MSDTRGMLRHFLATLAYRTQKALRGAPESFGDFRAARGVRTPRELVRHMTSVLGYARTHFVGGHYHADLLPSLADESVRFHQMLDDLAERLASTEPLNDTTEDRLLQGPFSDAMTHAGQLAMLRRLAGSPIPPENFIVADIDAGNVTADQPPPVDPDEEWFDAESAPG
jgi:hypothetical protein